MIRFSSNKFSRLKKCIILIILCTILPSFAIPAPVFAQNLSILPAPGSFVDLSSSFNPLILQGFKTYPDDPFKFDFIFDKGESEIREMEFEKECERLIKYFLASITIPENNLWVNLSPYEQERIIPESLSQTDLGIDMLAQDYLLKQITASLIHPEKDFGKKFWDKVYKKAYESFGTTNVPVNTFNKVWILPDQAKVYVQDNHVIITKSRLKVMLDQDFLALKKNIQNKEIGMKKGHLSEKYKSSELSSAIVKEILLPEIEREVNEGKNFAKIRQIYNSLILAQWFKGNLKESILNNAYSNQSKISGIESKSDLNSEQIYNQYLEAFQKGVCNYIKVDYDQYLRKQVPRKYFSGGLVLMNVDPTTSPTLTNEIALSKKAKSGDLVMSETIILSSKKANSPIVRKAVRSAGRFLKTMALIVALNLAALPIAGNAFSQTSDIALDNGAYTIENAQEIDTQIKIDESVYSLGDEISVEYADLIKESISLDDVKSLDGKKNSETQKEYVIDKDYFDHNMNNLFEADKDGKIKIGWEEETAIIALQKKLGISEDGDLGPKTLNQLLKTSKTTQSKKSIAGNPDGGDDGGDQGLSSGTGSSVGTSSGSAGPGSGGNSGSTIGKFSQSNIIQASDSSDQENVNKPLSSPENTRINNLDISKMPRLQAASMDFLPGNKQSMIKRINLESKKEVSKVIDVSIEIVEQVVDSIDKREAIKVNTSKVTDQDIKTIVNSVIDFNNNRLPSPIVSSEDLIDTLHAAKQLLIFYKNMATELLYTINNAKSLEDLNKIIVPGTLPTKIYEKVIKSIAIKKFYLIDPDKDYSSQETPLVADQNLETPGMVAPKPIDRLQASRVVTSENNKTRTPIKLKTRDSALDIATFEDPEMVAPKPIDRLPAKKIIPGGDNSIDRPIQLKTRDALPLDFSIFENPEMVPPKRMIQLPSGKIILDRDGDIGAAIKFIKRNAPAINFYSDSASVEKTKQEINSIPENKFLAPALTAIKNFFSNPRADTLLNAKIEIAKATADSLEIISQSQKPVIAQTDLAIVKTDSILLNPTDSAKVSKKEWILSFLKKSRIEGDIDLAYRFLNHKDISYNLNYTNFKGKFYPWNKSFYAGLYGSSQPYFPSIYVETAGREIRTHPALPDSTYLTEIKPHFMAGYEFDRILNDGLSGEVGLQGKNLWAGLKYKNQKPIEIPGIDGIVFNFGIEAKAWATKGLPVDISFPLELKIRGLAATGEAGILFFNGKNLSYFDLGLQSGNFYINYKKPIQVKFGDQEKLHEFGVYNYNAKNQIEAGILLGENSSFGVTYSETGLGNYGFNLRLGIPGDQQISRFRKNRNNSRLLRVLDNKNLSGKISLSHVRPAEPILPDSYLEATTHNFSDVALDAMVPIKDFSVGLRALTSITTTTYDGYADPGEKNRKSTVRILPLAQYAKDTIRPLRITNFEAMIAGKSLGAKGDFGLYTGKYVKVGGNGEIWLTGYDEEKSISIIPKLTLSEEFTIRNTKFILDQGVIFAGGKHLLWGITLDQPHWAFFVNQPLLGGNKRYQDFINSFDVWSQYQREIGLRIKTKNVIVEAKAGMKKTSFEGIRISAKIPFGVEKQKYKVRKKIKYPKKQRKKSKAKKRASSKIIVSNSKNNISLDQIVFNQNTATLDNEVDSYGGINFTESFLEIDKQGISKNLQLNKEALMSHRDAFNAAGFAPIIINIVPITNLQTLLSL